MASEFVPEKDICGRHFLFDKKCKRHIEVISKQNVISNNFFFLFFFVALIPELEGREMEFTLNLGFVLEM